MATADERGREPARARGVVVQGQARVRGGGAVEAACKAARAKGRGRVAHVR